MKIRSTSISETQSLARSFLAKCIPEGVAVVVGLEGDLGSGKTTFTQAAALALGIEEAVTSPTFIIEKIYKLKNHTHFEHLIHIDAYRLERGKELLQLGWREIQENPKNLIFVEWPEKVADILPKSMKKIHFTFIDENTREIVIP